MMKGIFSRLIFNMLKNYHTTKFFTKNLLAIEIRKTQILMNRPVYLGLSIIDMCKTVMYEFWYDYVKAKYGEKVNLCYMDKDSFIVQIRKNNVYKDIAEDVKKRFGSSNYELDIPSLKGKYKLRGLIITWKITRSKNYLKISWTKSKNL